MKVSIISVIIVCICCISCNRKDVLPSISGENIIDQSISYHDPESLWDSLQVQLHIQEPRISNPTRYSIITFNNINGEFQLIRTRDKHISTHIIDSSGLATTLFNNNMIYPDSIKSKYNLDTARNKGYKDFYTLLYGLPMSLKGQYVMESFDLVTSSFNKANCYKIPIELNKPMFSKHWIVYIDVNNYQLKGIDIVYPGEPEKGERLLFDGEIKIKGIRIPRVRHWNELATDNYSGSDIIVKELN